MKYKFDCKTQETVLSFELLQMYKYYMLYLIKQSPDSFSTVAFRYISTGYMYLCGITQYADLANLKTTMLCVLGLGTTRFNHHQILFLLTKLTTSPPTQVGMHYGPFEKVFEGILTGKLYCRNL